MNFRTMIKTYFKTAWRNLFRNKTTTLISLSGLSVAMAAFAFIALWVQNELSFDDYHKNAKDIFLVEMKYVHANEANPITPLPLAELLKKSPDLEFAARIGRWPGARFL